MKTCFRLAALAAFFFGLSSLGRAEPQYTFDSWGLFFQAGYEQVYYWVYISDDVPIRSVEVVTTDGYGNHNLSAYGSPQSDGTWMAHGAEQTFDGTVPAHITIIDDNGTWEYDDTFYY